MNHLPVLSAMGIEVWQRKNLTAKHLTHWEQCEAAVSHCTLCPLHQTRTQTVFGVGNRQSQLMFIGEAPGFYEDKEGKPFVGRAGQLLTAMLESMALAREDVFIANILKCRPPQNRDPLPEEVATCTPYLEQQIQMIQPKLLIALGRISAHFLLNTKTSLHQLRQTVHHYKETPLIVTFHPAYLLRNPSDKNKAFQDLQFIQQTLRKITKTE